MFQNDSFIQSPSDPLEPQSHPPNEQQSYKKIRILGQGSMGKAYLVQSRDGHLYVMKRINIGHLSPDQQQLAMRQAQLHSMIVHKNVIQFKEIYHTTGDKMCIIMEYAQNGDLEQYIEKEKETGKCMDEGRVLAIFGQICAGMRAIHAKKIIHRDIKGANIFLTTDNVVKIGDFGISKVIDQTVQASKSFVGTPYYLSPQMVQGKPYSTKADIWAMGVLLYYMCAQRLPFEANSLPLLALKILKGSFPPISGPYSRELKTLILSMLQVDQKKRPTVTEILLKPLISKYVPKQQSQQLQQIRQQSVHTPISKPKQQKNKIPRNQSTNLSTSSANNILITGLVSPIVGQKLRVLKKDGKNKISQEEKKAKQKEIRDEKKKKREQEFREMKEDLKKKRLEAAKQKGASSKALQLPQGQKPLSTKALKKSPAKNVDPEPLPEPIEKPWKSKSKQNSKKQVQIQIRVPSLKPKQPKKQQVVADPNFQIQIKQYGKRPILLPETQKTSQTQLIQQSQQQQKCQQQQQQHEQLQQQQQISQNFQYSQQDSSQSQPNNFKQMLQQLNTAKLAVQGLNMKLAPGKKIQLYEQSQNFDDESKNQNIGNVVGKSEKKSKPSPYIQNKNMSTFQQQSWDMIQYAHNSDNLQECRQILEQGLGEQAFLKAYQILNAHLQESEAKKLRGEELDNYTFNREVLRKKLDFIQEDKFQEYIVLLYTLIVIQLEEMKKNFQE